MRYFSLWNGPAPMAKCEAETPEKAVEIFKINGYHVLSPRELDENNSVDYKRLLVKEIKG